MAATTGVTTNQLEEFAKLQRIESRSRAIRKLLRNKGSVVGMILLLIIFFSAIVGPYLTGYDYIEMSSDILQAPSSKHLFGTDFYGRDTLSRTLSAAGTSILISIIATGVSTILGVSLGMISGFYGKATDRIISGFNDVLMAVPALLLVIMTVTVFGRSRVASIGAISVAFMPGTMRLSRGQVMTIKQREFVLALRSMGISDIQILYKHIMPNVIAPVIVSATITVGFGVMIESMLSYVGLGVPIPDCSLGSLIMEGRPFAMTASWLTTMPGVFIALIIMGFSLFGDGLRDVNDFRDLS